MTTDSVACKMQGSTEGVPRALLALLDRIKMAKTYSMAFCTCPGRIALLVAKRDANSKDLQCPALF